MYYLHGIIAVNVPLQFSFTWAFIKNQKNIFRLSIGRGIFENFGAGSSKKRNIFSSGAKKISQGRVKEHKKSTDLI